MPHLIKEEHLEDICASCRKPHGNSVTFRQVNHKVYETIICQNCGYEIVRIRSEGEFSEKLDMFLKFKSNTQYNK